LKEQNMLSASWLGVDCFVIVVVRESEIGTGELAFWLKAAYISENFNAQSRAVIIRSTPIAEESQHSR
jgi:hypothetical protein